jgi:hypothetical protein
MNKVTIGLLLCMVALIMLNRNQPAVGLVLFVIGFLLMNKK